MPLEVMDSPSIVIYDETTPDCKMTSDDNEEEEDEGHSPCEDDEEEEEVESVCYTFSADLLASGDIVDVTSNCLDMQGLSEAAVELAKPTLLSRPLTSMSLNLPSVVIHSASNTPKKKKSNTKRSKSFHIKSKSELPALKLRLPGKKSAASGSDSKHYSSTIEESNSSCEHLDEAATNVEAKNKRQPRKRRKSLVNLLFPAKNNNQNISNNEKKNSISCSNQLHLLPTDPEDHTSIASNSGGQRLHFRRLSEIIGCVSTKPTSSQTKSKDDCNYNNLGTNNADLSNAIQVNKQIPTSPNTTAASSQFIHKLLFPYRRRKSSVNHLDNTELFHETKNESIEATRRRMSSFPPADGDESAIMLEKIHYLSTIEGDDFTRASTPVSASLSPLKLLKKSLKTGSNTTSGISKSTIEVSRCKDNIEVNNSNNPCGRFNDGKNLPFLAPSLTYSERRGSSPLVAELNALRAAELRDKKAAEAATASEPSNRPGVVVFPKRKIEDVPGIFIPKNKPSRETMKTKGDEDLGSRISQFLGVKEVQRGRRHSVSDPALLQHQLTSSIRSPKPILERFGSKADLKPRSPYASAHELILLLPRY